MIYRLHQAKILKRWGVLAIILLALMLTLPATQVSAQVDSQFFPQTGKTVSGKFLQYWRSNGGLSVFGYPITDATAEIDPETGKVFLTQWFERNRFELHPENAGSKYEVLMGLLGKHLRREALLVNFTFLPTTAASGSNNRFFKETEHNLSDTFLTYWQTNGGLERFGFPISEARDEVDPETGKVFLTQWFERARFELHPENKGTKFEVLLGLLGKQLKTAPPVAEFKWALRLRTGSIERLSVDSQGNVWMEIVEPVYSLPYLGFKTKIAKFDNQGRPLFEFMPLPIQSDDSGMSISDMTIDKDGNIYLAKYKQVVGRDKDIWVEKFNSEGHSLMTFGNSGTAAGQFPNFIRSLTVDQSGNIYAATFSSYAATKMGGIINKYDQAGNFITRIGSTGEGDGQFLDPTTLAIDEKGNLLVLDQTRGDVQKLDSNGNFISSIDSNCLPTSARNSPTIRHLAINQKGRVYISYSKNDFVDHSLCIQRISPDNKAEVVFNSGGVAMGQLNVIAGVAVDNDDNFFAVNLLGQAPPTRLDKFHFR